MLYQNQYAALDAKQRTRTTFEPSLTDYACIRGFDPKTGVLQTTLSILLTKLCNELRKSSLQPGDWAEYQLAVADCNIVLGGQRITPSDSPTREKPTRPIKTPHRNVGRRVKGLAQKTT